MPQQNNYPDLAAVVLAAGKGTRMQSETPKVLHSLGGEPLIFHTLKKLESAGIKNIYVVISYQAETVRREISKFFDCKFVYQPETLGTANAAKVALDEVSPEVKQVLVLNGDDSAFYLPQTISFFIKSHFESGAVVSFMTVKVEKNLGLGRVIRSSSGKFEKILEDEEYKESNLKSDEINCGKYIFNRGWFLENIDKVPVSKKGEYYLTEILNIAREQGDKINIFELKDKSEWFGVNTQEDLKRANLLITKNQ